MRKSISLLVLCWVITVFGLSTARAANIFWDGTGTSWNAASFWSSAGNATTPDPAAKPGAGDIANFNISTVNSAQTVNLDAAQAALGLVFNSTGTVLIQTGSGTNTLTLGTSGITVNSGAGADTISSAVSLGSPQSWTNDSSNVLTVSGNISNAANLLIIAGTGNTTLSGILGNGSGALTKSGTGALTLSGANTYAGLTTVSGGTLVLGNASALGTTAGATNVASGATLDLGGSAIGAEPLTITGAGVAGNGALVNSSASAASLAGVVTINGPVTIGGTGNITLGGSVNAGNNVLTKIGSGTLTLSGTTDNNSLAVTVSSGTVLLAKTSSPSPNDVHSIGQDILTVNGGTAQLGGTGGDQIYDLGSVVVTSGAFDTNGRNETFATLSLQGTGIGGNGALVNTGFNTFSTITPTGGTVLTGNASIGVNSNSDITLNNAISGNFALTKVGPGQLDIKGVNTFNGGLFIQNGSIQINSINNAGTNGALGNNTSVTLGSSGQSGTLIYNGSSTSTNMPFVLAADGTGGFYVTTGGVNLTLNGTISGDGKLEATVGTLALGASNTFTGGVQIDFANLQLANPGALNSSSPNAVTFGGAINGTAMLTLNGNSVTISGLATTPGSDVAHRFVQDGNAASATLTVNNSADFTFAGVLQNGTGGGTLALVKSGSGTQTLSGANTFTGGVTINAGNLQLGSAGALNSTSPNAVNFGAASTGTLSLGGNSVTISVLSGNSSMSTIQNGSPTAATLTLNSGGITVFGGKMQDGAGSAPLSFIKNGGGLLNIIGGGAKTFTGSLTINAGELDLDNNNSLTGGAIINGASVFFLGGGGGGTSPDVVTFGPGSSGSLAVGVSTTIGGLNTDPTTVGAPVVRTDMNGFPATLTINNAGPNTYAGVMQDAGSIPLSIAKSGAGTLTLKGSNTFTGTTMVNAGTLALGSVNALGSTIGGTIVSGGGTLDLAGQAVGAEPFAISGTGVGGNGALINSSNTPASYSGIINGTVNSQSFTVGGSGDMNLIGSINGNTLLTKIGNSSLTISGTNDNFGLSANVSSGTLVLAKTSSHTPDVHAIGGNAPLFGMVVSGGTAQLGGTGGDQIYDFANVTVTSGVFDANGRSETIATLSLQGTGLGGAGALVNSASAASVFTPTSTSLTGNASIGVTQSGGSLTLAGGINGNFTLTKVGPGTLTLSGPGTVACPINVTAGTLIQGGATVTGSVSNFASYVLNSGTFGGPFLTSSGTFTYNAGTFSGRLINAGTVNFNADFTAGNGLENDVSLSIPSGRMITLNGQGLDNEATLTVSGGTFNLSTGAIAANINRGTLNLAGTTNIHGDLNNNTGGIALTAGGATTTFFDNVVNNGSIITSAGARTVFRGSYSGAGALPGAGVAEFAGDIRPGNSPAILQVGGDAIFDSTARSIIEIGGTAPGTQFDQTRVQGQLTLGGTLNVSLINGFAPATGNSFDILDWGTRSGTFSSLQLPGLPGGLQWNTSQLTTTGVLSISGSNFAAGDFNRDGHVNAADIPAMLAALTDLNSYKATNSLSDANLLSIGDIDSSGAVTNADVQALLDLLKSGGGSVDAVPEPPSIALMALAAVVFAESVGARRSSRHHLGSTARAGKCRG